ncbi:kinase-like domain-containing protein [Suillus discolor]|uniref:Kinase-like domain-containing protein n=1 Tax=Suillus discolor TaxID=1912936 RepID=A0A9P7JM01_9AGAM|nr:kinase-like domain-containing protein [Suillus discolor]KAG2088083.1 kinase-like domain-containing protein [Suillus discolor]
MILSFLSHCRSWLENVGRKSLSERSRSSVMIATTGSSEIDPDNHLSDLTGFVSKELPHPIAHGSFGDVWKCTYIASNRPGLEVAVKSIRIDVAGDESRARVTQRLLGDFRARKQLHHENLLPLLGFSHEFGLLPAMVSPWIHNGSLTTHLEHHFTEMTIEQKFLILRQVAAAISYLHSKGVIHGDLTANNILIDSDHNAHVADHGILPMYSDLSGISYIRSNMRWAAPELFGVPENEESSTLQPASDIYSFGCIMLQVMTGLPPYADVQHDYQVIALILKGRKPTRPSSPHDADSFWDFIERCWGDIGRRPSAVDVLNFLGSDPGTALQTESCVKSPSSSPSHSTFLFPSCHVDSYIYAPFRRIIPQLLSLTLRYVFWSLVVLAASYCISLACFTF